MDFEQLKSWNWVKFLEINAGCWPFQNPRKNLYIRVFSFMAIVTVYIPLAIKLMLSLDQYQEIVIENSLFLMIIHGLFAKSIVLYLNEKQRGDLYREALSHLDAMDDEGEKEILRVSSESATKWMLTYLFTTITLGSFYHIIPLAHIHMNYFLRANATPPRQLLHINVEYFMEDEDIYYYIIGHFLIVFVFGGILFFAHDLGFMALVKDNCALYEITCYRLRNCSSRGSSDSRRSQGLADDEIHANVLRANDMYQLAMSITDRIEKAYNITWFVLLVQNMSSFGTCIMLLYIQEDPIEFIRYITVVGSGLIHFQTIFYSGQKIIDSSQAIYHACFHTDWFTFPRRTRNLLIIMMMRSAKPCKLTGGKAFILCMSTMRQFVLKGLVYFLVFAVE
ncbi:uncharacterized protein LOC106652041 [Trichogramma pretiosum]|uniref:uncharacterized protein LOC106652041 n=1 Tax=Trichogramma pretiosum TaxID=7493 RepID=UPI0006C97D9E|nr:uncharacterized protein LOC106652041 [Trichogramma pretiosum]